MEDTETDQTIFNLAHDGVDHLVLETGVGGAEVEIDHGSSDVRTETIVKMPRAQGCTTQGCTTTSINAVTLPSVRAPVALLGEVDDVRIGRWPRAASLPENDCAHSGANCVAHQLGEFASVLMISGPTDAKGARTKASLRSGSGEKAPRQLLQLDGRCLDVVAASDGSSTQDPLFAPSPLFCSQLTAAGFAADSCSLACAVQFHGAVSFDILTGGADDAFHGVDSISNVTVGLGDGKDDLAWARTAARAVFDLGSGKDYANFSAPIGETAVRLGGESSIDIVQVYYGSTPPQCDPCTDADGNQLIAPLGAANDSRLLVAERDTKDHISSIHGEAPGIADLVPRPPPGRLTPFAAKAGSYSGPDPSVDAAHSRVARSVVGGGYHYAVQVVATY